MVQDTAQARQRTEQAHCCTRAKSPRTPHEQSYTPNGHTGEQEPSGPRHRTHVRAEGYRGTGNNKPHPMGRAHRGDTGDPAGQKQGQYP